MKHARIAYRGALRTALVEENDELLLMADGQRAGFDEVVWLPPLEPRTVFALGLNYVDHATELSFKAPERPLIFLKGPNTFVGHNGYSPCPADVRQMHFECELAVVIGRKGRRIRQEQAYDYVAGYTIANDYALREYLENYYRPNLRVKNRDFCTPLGPWMVDAMDIADPMALGLRTFVNGEAEQHGNTRDMIFGIPALIEYLSDFMTLSPGDLILTGTPKGVRYLEPGDEVITEIDEIGRLANTIIPEPNGRRHELVPVSESPSQGRPEPAS
jgi:5-oxopent-3-ene-1,2,5-tricarboxylate decarboxylase / 2-hydroxyhepta-2,4-diene-1,7-dioate isomerase